MRIQNIKISVVITTFNRAELVVRAIKSVLNQKSAADEIIVIDDGSTDETAAIIRQKYPQIRFFFQENQGISAARNLGISQAIFPWIAFLDSDDEWLPAKLLKQRDIIIAHPQTKICHTNEIWIRNGKRVNQMNKHKKYGGHIYKYCLPLCIISPSSVLLHRDIFTRYGVFDTNLPACEDYDLWLRICAFETVSYLDEALIIKYGGHSDQLSHKYWGMDRFRISALIKMLENRQLDPENRKATMMMLLEKIRIYTAGAAKRNKDDEIEYYRTLYQKYDAELKNYSTPVS